MVDFNKLVKQDYATDKKAEVEGAWVRLRSNAFDVLVARNTSPRYIEELKRQMRPFTSNGRLQQNAPTEKIEHALCKAMAKTLLLGWREDADKEAHYDEATAYSWLSENPDFRNEISEIAETMAVFRKEQQEEDAKNSPKPSSGK